MLFKSFRPVLVFLILIPALAFAVTRTIYINSRGSDSDYCNSNSGSSCFNQVKRGAQQEAYRDAVRTCEFNHRGRPLTYTISTSSFCSPAFLPPQHDGTFVNCRATGTMQCEVEK